MSTRLEPCYIFSIAPMLPVSEPGQLIFPEPHDHCNPQKGIMQATFTKAGTIRFNINKSHFFTISIVRFYGCWAFTEVITLPEYFIRFFFSGRFPISVPYNIRSFIYQGPAKIAMIKQHVRSYCVSPIDYFILNPDDGLAKRSRYGAFQFEARAKYLSLFHYSGNAHFHFAQQRIRLYN